MNRQVAKMIKKRAGIFKMPRSAYRTTKRNYSKVPWNKRAILKRRILEQISRRLSGQDQKQDTSKV